MNLLKSAALTFLLLSIGGAAHADSKPEPAPARATQAKNTPTEASPGKRKKAAAMSVRHKTRAQPARAKLRGDLGLDPTAGLGRKGVLGEQLQKRSDRSASMSVFLDKQRLELKPKARAKKPSVPKKPKAPVERFEPGALDFMD
ncbi:MAG: hypothetical protein KJO07_24920 [Deltaproteobacteria bacterium]|nr:hypothetical protein [Deltaproteobacteria bacterium]